MHQNSPESTIGKAIHNLATELWPINRSLTGDGVRQSLEIIKKNIPDLKLFEIPSGTKAFDWTIPKEWKINDAYIITPKQKKICSFKENNLHLMGYSTPINKKIPLKELKNHLYTLPKQPKAIPYITSYYKERWGFCISHDEYDSLEDGTYEVFIDSALFDGSLTYGELFIPGSSEKEILISTYICHPSMANNELSGPTVATFIAKWLLNKPGNKLSYRFIFIPETIGSIAYISKNINHLKSKVIAGFNVTCVGDDREYSYLPSRNGETLADKVSQHVLKHIYPNYKSYKWSDRGSDERQWCAPGVDLPIASIMRTKYGMYEEYHTSLDNLVDVVTPEGLEGGYKAIKYAIEAIEKNTYPRVTVLCEPQLSKRGLYPTLSTKSSGAEVELMMNLITWADGTKSLLEIAELCEVPIWNLYPIIQKLCEHKILELYESRVS